MRVLVRRSLVVGSLVLAGAGGGGIATAGTGGSGWTQPGANSRHDNYNSYETRLGSGDLQQLQRVWRVAGAPTDGTDGQETLPVLGGGRAYLGTVGGAVQAREPATGRLLWWAQLPPKPVNSGPAAVRQPAYSGGSLLVTRFGGPTPSSFYLQLIGLDPATGRTRWLRGNGQLLTAGAGLAFSYNVVCDSAGCSRFRLDAVDTRTGRLAWFRVLWSDPSGYGHPPLGAFDARAVLNAGTLYLYAVTPHGSPARVPGRLTALDARTGRLRWAGPVANPTAIEARTGTVIATTDTAMIGVDPGTGARRWTRSDLNAGSGIAAGSGRVYAACTGRAVCTVDARTGADTSVQLDDPATCSGPTLSGLALVPGRLFAHLSCGVTPAGVTALDTATGQVVPTSITSSPGEGLVLAGGRLYTSTGRTLSAWALPAAG